MKYLQGQHILILGLGAEGIGDGGGAASLAEAGGDLPKIGEADPILHRDENTRIDEQIGRRERAGGAVAEVENGVAGDAKRADGEVVAVEGERAAGEEKRAGDDEGATGDHGVGGRFEILES